MQADDHPDDTKKENRVQSRKARQSRRQSIFYSAVIGCSGTFYTGLYSLFVNDKFDWTEIGTRAAFMHGGIATAGGMISGGFGIFAASYLDEKISRFAGDNKWKQAVVAIPRLAISVGLPLGGIVAGGAGTYQLTEPYAFDMGEKVYETRQKTKNFFENLNDTVNQSNHGDTIHVNGGSTLVLKHLEMTP